MDKFQQIPYNNFENNRDDINREDDTNAQNNTPNLSLYISAEGADDNKLIYDVNLNSRSSSKLVFNKFDEDDNIASFIDNTTENEVPNLDSKFFIKQKRGNNNNKFVNEQTLNSYLSISDLQEDVKENVDICRNTLRKAYERGSKVKEIEEKSEGLLEGSNKFKKSSRQLKRKMYIKYLFNYLALVVMIIIIVFLIIKLT